MPQPTTNKRGYPQPHPDNTLMTDVSRIAQALEMIDQDIDAANNQHTAQTDEVNKRLHRVRLNTLLNENLFVI